MKSRIYFFLLTASLVLMLFVSASSQEVSTTASFLTNTREAIPVNVLVGQSRVISFDSAIERFSVSNPEVAEAVLITSNQVVVNGKSFGQINLIAWQKGTGRFVVFDVFVRTNLSLIDSQIHALFPKDDIRLSQANGSVVLSGNVSDPSIGSQAEAVVQAAGFKTVNMLNSPVKDLVQVQLQVRVAEVNRTRMRELGSSYSTIGGGTSVYSSGGGPASLSKVDNGSLFTEFAGSALNLFLFNKGLGTQAFIRAMQQQGALRALAEPNLIAMNGQQASFLAGGEFPVPIVQAGGAGNGTVSIVFKEYGVRLTFKPTIIDEDHIRLELEPEVSTLDFVNGVKFNGFLIPALRTRRAKTGVELRDGQSFALAGLLDNNESKTLSKVPALGDIPILGNLFKSTSFQKNETELMFIVTAQIAKSVSPDDLPKMPAVEGLKKGSLLGIDSKTGITGPTGFITTPTEAPKNPTTPASESKPDGSESRNNSPAVAATSAKPKS